MENDFRQLAPLSWLCPAEVAMKGALPKVAALGGDDIGPDVTKAAVRCILASKARVEIIEPPHGEQAFQTLGTAFPPEAKQALIDADAILYGAWSGRSREILRFIRFGLQTYANIRPARSMRGVDAITGRGVTDLVIVRELTEGQYPGAEGRLEDLTRAMPDFVDCLGRSIPKEGTFSLGITTEAATRRVAKYAVKLALRRKSLGGRGHVTVVTKSNVLPKTDGVFQKICEQELDAAGLSHDHVYVDEAARRLVARPEAFDVIVTPNLYGDILSDVSAEVLGGMPMAPSAGIGDRVAYFEPCHGGAPDIANKGIANPSGAIMSAAMMLVYLQLESEAARIFRALEQTLARGQKTVDLGGTLGTEAFTEAVCRAMTEG